MKNNILLLLPPSGFSDEGYLFMKRSLSVAGFIISIASSSTSLIKGLSGIKVQPEIALRSVHASNFKALLITGGEGWLKPTAVADFIRIVKLFNDQKQLIAAVCSGPVVLAKSGILQGKKAVCNPLYKQELIKADAVFTDTEYVIDGNILTGRGAEALPVFSLNFVNLLNAN